MTVNSRAGTASLLAAGLVFLFAFRLAFGLASEFLFEDETQIYLMGLRQYATGGWPFFGPDVVWTRSEIPGALQALLVGVPLSVAPVPEAPFVLLNLLSFSALALLAWYTTRRLPSLPRWLVWGWFLTIPWTLHYSTHIINPSYVLPAAIVFFLGFFEAMPVFSLGLVSQPIAYFMMGAALTWVMQIHMSWPLMLPFAAAAWLSRRAEGVGALARHAIAFVVGGFVPAILLIPTIVRYGAAGGSGGVFRNAHLHFVSPWAAVVILARLLSFSSLEINRFIATDAPKRLEFFQRHLWLAPAAVVVLLVGFVQPVWMLIEAVRPARRWPSDATRGQWLATRRLLFASVAVVYASYWFVMEPPQAHAFYVLAPIALVFAACCWTLIDSARWRAVAAVVLATNLTFHAGLALARAPERSLYKRRDVITAAIDLKQPDIFAHRRPFAIDAGPYSIDASVPHDAPRDLVLRSATYAPGPGSSVHWKATLFNSNRQVAYRDVLYFSSYQAADRRILESHEFIKDILQPCEAREIEFNDGVVKARIETASLRIAAAEALVPAHTQWCGGSVSAVPPR